VLKAKDFPHYKCLYYSYDGFAKPVNQCEIYSY